MANDQMPFGEALANLKAGRCVKRTLWKDADRIDHIKLVWLGGEGVFFRVRDYVHGGFETGWTPTNFDMLSDDWVLVDE